jgi:hypothetical protein
VLGPESGCGDGQICNFIGRLGPAAGQAERAVGFCQAGAGDAGTGAPCNENDDTGEHNCVNGHICSALQQGGPTQCIKLCDNGDNVCPAGFECTTGVFGGDEQGNGASENIGFCAEMQDG